MKFRALIAIIFSIFCSSPSFADEPKTRVLVFGKTIRPAHAAIIPIAGQALAAHLTKYGFEAIFTQDPELINASSLKSYKAVVLLDVTETILSTIQQTALESFFTEGGGLVAIHGTIAAGKDWPWLHSLLETEFVDHAAEQTGTVRLAAPNESANHLLPSHWSQFDEWYNFSSEIKPPAKILQVADDSTINGSKGVAIHPMTWSQQIGKGRFLYTALGHGAKLYLDENAEFVTMLTQAIRWVSWLNK